jgi:hypothetical protein
VNPATPPHRQAQKPINKHPSPTGQETRPRPDSLFSFPWSLPLIPCSTKTYPLVADHFPAQAHNRTMFAVAHARRRSPKKQPQTPPLPHLFRNPLNRSALDRKTLVSDSQTKDLRRPEAVGILCALHRPLPKNR